MDTLPLAFTPTRVLLQPTPQRTSPTKPLAPLHLLPHIPLAVTTHKGVPHLQTLLIRGELRQQRGVCGIGFFWEIVRDECELEGLVRRTCSAEEL